MNQTSFINDKADKPNCNWLKRINVILGLLFAIPLNIFCQDIIVLKNGNEISSKVLEITTNEIKYKKFDNLDGPVISMLKSEVKKSRRGFILQYLFQ